MASFETTSTISSGGPTLKTYRGYLAIWAGQIISVLGSNVVQFVMIWWITIETQNAMALSLATFFGFLPNVILAPFAGVIADKMNRQKIMILSDFCQALVTFALIGALYFDVMRLWLFFTILALRATFGTLQGPAKSAIVSLMVPKDKLSRLNGLNYLFNNIMSLLGAPIAAVLLNFFDFYQLLFIDIITFFFALIPLLLVKIPQLDHVTNKAALPKVDDYRQGIREAVRFLKANTPFLALMLTATFVNFFIMPFETLMSYYIGIENGGSEAEYALIMVAQQVGLIAGAILTSVKKRWARPMVAMRWALTLQFCGFFIVGLAPLQGYWVMVVGMFISGTTFPVTNTVINTIFQSNVPNEVQGRIMSVINMISGAICPLGMVISAPLAGVLGTRLLFALSGVIPLIGVQLIWALTPVSQAAHVHYEPPEPAGDAPQEHLGDALIVASAVEEDQPIGQVGD